MYIEMAYLGRTMGRETRMNIGNSYWAIKTTHIPYSERGAVLKF